MKKKLLSLVLCAALALPLFAREANSGLGFSFGARFSVLGLEPTVALLFNHLEVEASAPLSASHSTKDVYNEEHELIRTDIEGYSFGFAPSISIGYNSKPFTSGWQNGIGFTGLWITDNYLAARLGAYDTASIFDGSGSIDFNQGGYVGSLYYRGAIQFKSGFSIYFRTMVPLAVYIPALGDAGWFTVVEPDFFPAVISVAFLATSVGVRFTF